MLDYINLDELNHFEMMLVWLVLLSIIFIVVYIVDKKNMLSNEEILKKRLSSGELSLEEFRILKKEL